jgi:hypothetical protein
VGALVTAREYSSFAPPLCCSYEPHGLTCDKPGCGWRGCWACEEERWYDAHPLEAAERDAEEAEAEALRAEEGAYEDWRALRAEANAAWRLVDELRAEAEGRGSQGPERAERSDAHP